MLEQKIDELIAALNRNTAAQGGDPPAEEAAPRAGLRKAGKPTFEMVKAAVMSVKDDHGKPAALKVINGPGKAKDLASIKPAQYQAVLDACEELATPPAEDDAGGDDDSL